MGDAPLPLDEATLRRAERAGLDASAPGPAHDHRVGGWWVRTAPGKARRSRCVNAVASPALMRPAQVAAGLPAQLDACEALYRAAGLPTVFRITPFTQPPALDPWLQEQGWTAEDATRVMLRTTLADLRALPDLPDAPDLAGAPALANPSPLPRDDHPLALPEGITEVAADAHAFAAVIGALRGSSSADIAVMAARLAACPVPHRGVVWRRGDDVVACGQSAQGGSEPGWVGLFDLFTAPPSRGQGLATRLCRRLLAHARAAGASAAYLQVEASNAAALAVYRRLGFADAYGYHYRVKPPAQR